MNFRKLSIFIFILSLSGSFLFAQNDSKTTSKKEKKEKIPKEKKIKPVKTKSSSNENEGGDKNFGPIFDGVTFSTSVGMNNYFGDIAAYNLFPRPNQFKEHITSAFKLSVAKEIKWGVGIKLNYQVGSLIGTRRPGKKSALVNFRNNFYDFSIQAQYSISDAWFKWDKKSRFRLFFNLGVGTIFYRSQLIDSETFFTRDYEGFIEIDKTNGTSLKLLSDKTPIAKALTIPYGLKLTYKVSHKTDIHIDFTQSATTTDRLDAFSRSFSANDKYNFIGIGITYNFNRTADDAPKKRPKKDKSNDKSTVDSSSETKSNKNIKKGIFAKKNKLKKDSGDDELLNIRLKLFETQLKLFEMQYLLGK